MSYLFLRKSAPLARKMHRCIWCGESILRGAGYIRVAGVFEGDFQSDAFHPECRTAAEEQFDSGDCEFSPFDNERPELA